MAGNTFGKMFQVSTYGESHGPVVGAVVDGCPSGIEISERELQLELDRRRPGQSELTTSRSEQDAVAILSGVFEGKTTGAPITLQIENKDQRSGDYDELKDIYRPSHADYTYHKKYGVRDHRGGGRSSVRETAARVAAGAIAKKFLAERLGIEILSFVERVGTVSSEVSIENLCRDEIESNHVRCPDPQAAAAMQQLIASVKEEGDSVGGVVRGVLRGVPLGLGEPVFDKLPADLGKAMLSINAVKGFEFGSGFEGTKQRGSEHNDAFIGEGIQIRTQTNNSGGTLGGISNGEIIHFRVAFKPTSTIRKVQSTVNISGEEISLRASGRHDPCVLPRAVPIVDAMAAIVLMDHYLRFRATHA